MPAALLDIVLRIRPGPVQRVPAKNTESGGRELVNPRDLPPHRRVTNDILPSTTLRAHGAA